jgi:hypothetical protein
MMTYQVEIYSQNGIVFQKIIEIEGNYLYLFNENAPHTQIRHKKGILLIPSNMSADFIELK